MRQAQPDSRQQSEAAPDGSRLCGFDPRISDRSIVAENCPDCCSLCPRKTTKTTTTTNPQIAQVDTVTPYQTITLFGTVSNSATSRISKNGRKYTAFGVAIISDRNLQAFHYNVVAFGKQGHFAKPLQTGTRIKLVVQAQSQPDNIATLPLLTATFVQPVRPVARG
jgi:hypothetical protein